MPRATSSARFYAEEGGKQPVSKADWRTVGFIGGVIGLIWDVAQAREHKHTCPKCMRRDYLTIALDVAHLAQT
jgi:hypothetical protein